MYRQRMPGGSDCSAVPPLRVGIACGGTGGHLFPGLAVAEVLRQRGAEVTLFVSPKEVDRRAVRGVHGCAVEVLPVAAWQAGSRWRCLTGWLRAWRRVRRLCRAGEAWVVLGMGGFSSVPVLGAARRAGHPVFLHESNAVPGRANRWLVRWVDRAFVGFECAAKAWPGRPVECTGTPVRSSFAEAGRLDAIRRADEQRRVRLELGLEAEAPTVLVVGGSQGARGLNEAVLQALPQWQRTRAPVQWIHVTGQEDESRVRAAYAAQKVRAVVMPFSEAMAELMLAATVVLSRAGASFLAELAAVGVPALLVPFPAAADDHQWHNARCLADSGAARVLRQSEATPERLIRELGELLDGDEVRRAMVTAQRRWHRPEAAARIAEALWEAGQQRVAEVRPRVCCGPTVAAIHG
ncbi:undecaprenyldiphospho-muramoylpentapeptide beta-N-acetylglucosaminyltransferase [Limisphaera sp. VF-2]|uniref:undecaprenyldiphospho-muramoylpentapeptide beta-N-acetylglucosaminyltransferase n=1 Tax=Limisphaera sp. VF-2 TaxID=3400418 RepID=UPI0017A3099D